jgi:mannose-1-phosphate guanylyltransferase
VSSSSEPPGQALLLTAGLGTRLRPLTIVRAKPAIPVAGEPLARRIVRWLATNGVTDLVANLHHLPATMTAALGDCSDLGARLRYSWEQPIILGSAGGPRHALSIVGADRFLVVNGDSLADVDLRAMAAAHASSGALATLALVPNRFPLRYGGVHLDDGSVVRGFVKRGPGAAGSFHFIGVQVVEAAAFRPLADGCAASSIGGRYDELIAALPGSIRGFVSEAAFRDIGTVADYWQTSFAIEGCPDGRGWQGRNVQVDPDARVNRSIIWDNARIGANCAIDECIVTDGVDVPADAAYRRTILLKTESGVAAMPFTVQEEIS